MFNFYMLRSVARHGAVLQGENHMITRRHLVRSAVAGAVLSTFAFSTAFAADKTLNADIVVVGAGSAGLSAAVQAAEKGAKVVLLEKNFFIGGNSQHAEGLFAIESEYQRLRSDPMTRAEAFHQVRERHQYALDPIKARDFIYGSGENIDWLAKHDIKFRVVRMTPWEEATWHEIREYKGAIHGAALVKALKDHADKLGVTTMIETPAKELITNAKGEVVGVKAQSEDDNYTIKAKAVILASGSFGDNKQLVKEWAGRDPEKWKSSVPINKTGDGITMAVKAGAERGPVTFIGHLGTEGKGIDFASALYTTSWQPSALWVNAAGKRFVNEDVALSFSQAANAIYAQYGHQAWSIWDDTQVKYMVERGVDSGVGVIVPVGMKLTKLPEQIDKALKVDSDGFKAATSVRELAKKIGVPAKELQKQLDAYNAACKAEHDAIFGKDVKYMRPINTKKLYAIRLGSYFFSAIGGLNTTREFQVLDVNNKPIKGLYATGLEVSNMVGHSYTTWTSGWAFGFACYSGRHAALNAAKAIGLK